MDGFFSKYGWTVVIGVCITFVVAMLSPVGNLVMGETIGFVDTMSDRLEYLITGEEPALKIPDGVEVKDYTLTSSNYTWCGIEERSGDIVVPEYFIYNDEYYKTVAIGNDAFDDCNELTSVKLPDSVTSIVSGAFYGCDNLLTVELPDLISSLDNVTFAYCKKLENINLPNNLMYVGLGVFSRCENLTELTFKNTPTSIDSSAFSDCSNLKTINVPWSEGEVANAPWGATKATINYNVK